MLRKQSQRRKSQGQNMVELVFTLPLTLVLIFMTIEMGRLWHAFNAAKMAAEEGSYTASLYHNAAAGQQRAAQMLNAARVNATAVTVAQVPQQHAYQATIQYTYTPFFGGLSMPTLSGPIQILPGTYNMSYQSINTPAVY